MPDNLTPERLAALKAAVDDSFAGEYLHPHLPTIRALLEERESIVKSNERLTDLVRFCRHKLHDEDLITDEEFAEILAEEKHPGAVKRLGGYDTAKAAGAREMLEMIRGSLLGYPLTGGDIEVMHHVDRISKIQYEVGLKKGNEDGAREAYKAVREAIDTCEVHKPMDDSWAPVHRRAVAMMRSILDAVENPGPVTEAREREAQS